MFTLTRSLIYKPIPINRMLKIFDKAIMPILLYGSDVCGTLSLKSKNICSENQILVPEKAYLSLEVENVLNLSNSKSESTEVPVTLQS